MLSILNQLDEPAERIEVIERIGKRLRQAQSIETARVNRDYHNQLKRQQKEKENKGG